MQRDLKHFTTPSFWDRYHDLPSAIQGLADKNFKILKSDLQHPSLQDLQNLDFGFDDSVRNNKRRIAYN